LTFKAMRSTLATMEPILFLCLNVFISLYIIIYIYLYIVLGFLVFTHCDFIVWLYEML
jgi:hypothetical protein